MLLEYVKQTEGEFCICCQRCLLSNENKTNEHFPLNLFLKYGYIVLKIDECLLYISKELKLKLYVN